MSIKQALKNTLPASLFHIARDLPWFVKELTRKAPAGKGPMPPLHLMFDGPRDYDLFVTNGQEALEVYKTIAQMKPTDAVLDIGCGIGRKTMPLLDYLTGEALYVGMDIDRRGIDWLLRNVTPKNPRFVFLHLDIMNKFYNPQGALVSSQLVFPFPAACFDIVALWSVFTHMYPDDAEHYLAEISRVLKPGGTLVASFFLYGEAAHDQMRRSEFQMDFRHQLPDCRTTNPTNPEDAIAFDDQWLKDTQRRTGLTQERVLYGAWSGHRISRNLSNINFQDIVVAKKSSS